MIFLVKNYSGYNNSFTQAGIEFSFTVYNHLDGMDTYLLLRSNKQYGPYTLQQLVSNGLKPYDLVWVEGKSAAWRYPGEIDALKQYAPNTEEQPFDRFYKKPEEKPVEVASVRPTEHSQEGVNAIPEQSISSPRKIFVSMPTNGTATKTVRPAQAATTTTQPIPVIQERKPEEKKIVSKPVYVTEDTYEPIVKENRAKKEEATLDEKYSESLDDIKRRYTETYLNRKKRSGWTSTHTSIAQVLGGAVFFCFLVVIVYKNFSGEESSQLSRTTIINPNKNDINKNTSPLTTTTNATTAPVPQKREAKNTKEVRQQATNEINPPDESLVTVPAVQKEEAAIDESDYTLASNTTEKKTDVTKNEEAKPKIRPVNIRKLVNVKANNYKQLAFGGVKNLELTINNDSKFELDKVIVELQYLKPSEQPVKTERVVFNSVGAGDSKTLRIPDYTRGVKISYRVIDIESSQYDRQTAGL